MSDADLPDPSAGPSLEQSLYERRQRIYPRQVRGFFASMRVTGVVVLTGIFFGLPWLRYDNGQDVRQAVLWNLPERKFHVFGLTFWPQDFIYLTALLIIAALFLFFFTAIAGRLWCGYACPQTVWTEIFLWIERKVEGSRLRQIRLDRGPWTAEKIARKTVKHALWIALSLGTGLAFVGYFTPIRELGQRLLVFQLGGWETFWILFLGLATYGNAGWMREQVCKHMCPYARFQGAMFDRDTLVIAYDRDRGEPRGSRSRSADPAALGLGDCVNCTMCVQVCPTGIDIRDGLQYECIGCAACIDTCNEVMDKVGYPRGLIRYTTERARSLRASLFRPRVVLYAAILAALLAATFVGISQRVPMALDVIRDRNVLFRESGDHIENVYTLKILNKSERVQAYRLEAIGDLPLQLLQDNPPTRVPPGQVEEAVVRVQAPRDGVPPGGFDFLFRLSSLADPDRSSDHGARFIGPFE